MTFSDVAALLAGSPFADRLARGAPLIVAVGQPPQVEFATPAVLALFGVASREALEAVVFRAESPGARRLRRLAESLPPGKPPRMESLRFYAGRRALPMGFLCTRIAAMDWQDFLVLATPQAAGEAEPAPAVAEVAVPVAPVAPSSAPTQRRFLWSLDAEGRFGAPDAALKHTVGANAPDAGETLDALAARVGLDPDGALAAALAAHKTFSALRLAWPEAEQPTARIALLSGTPAIDKGRFVGFRGFGLFTDETVPFARGEAPLSAEPAPIEEQPLASVAAPSEPAPPEVEPLAPVAPPERSAEIVMLRQAAPLPPGGPNVIPIRPGALAGYAYPAEETRRAADERETVELTNDERDAFREIARALGARLPLRSEEKAPEPPRARDLIDLLEAGAPEAPTPAAHTDAGELLDLLPIGAMVLRAGEPLYLNRTMLHLAGYADLAQLRAADGLTRMFRGRDVQTMAEESAGGAMPLVTADGDLVAVDAHVQTISWDDAPATLIALRRAREAEHQAELRALESDAKAHEAAARDLEATLEAATDGVIGLDAAGRIVTMSRAAQMLFGYELNDVAGESFLLLFAPQSQSEATARFEEIKQESGQRFGSRGEVLGRDRRGQSIAMTLAMARLAAPSSAARYCALIRDLSPAKAAERKLEAAREEAEQASARKTDFLARISHEVRTPLHAILGFAEVMMEERFGPVANDRYKDYIKDIHASAKHVVSLASDLLDLSKIEAGKLELEFAPVDANRIVRECVSLMQPQAAQERIIVRLSLFDKLPNVMADERSLRQILLNLMSNAVKFNEPGGQVIVSTAVDEAGHPVIRVRDTGAGMNEGELVAALEPFRQIGVAHRTGGAGLGLPLTKALAEANHAGFSIKSRKEQGTLVEVAFPTTQAAQ
ncbi:MAG TPA: ATP-binding protein [Roseiarcus sp.]